MSGFYLQVKAIPRAPSGDLGKDSGTLGTRSNWNDERELFGRPEPLAAPASATEERRDVPPYFRHRQSQSGVFGGLGGRFGSGGFGGLVLDGRIGVGRGGRSIFGCWVQGMGNPPRIGLLIGISMAGKECPARCGNSGLGKPRRRYHDQRRGMRPSTASVPPPRSLYVQYLTYLLGKLVAPEGLG
jgi:hypothetical protein